MSNCSTRSYKKELLDDPSIPFNDIVQNMRELNTVNTWLGGHNITLKGLQTILHQTKTTNRITVCEIGCGGGDNLKAMYKWCSKHNIDVEFIGIDILPSCIEYAKHSCKALPVEWITSDYALVQFQHKPSIIFSSLFCHHFTETELVKMLNWMKQNATQGFFINDLHRHWLAYYSIKFLTRLFSRSYLVKNDAPLSVQRGFIKNEWKALLQQANSVDATIQWQWAFRHLIVYYHGHRN